MCSKVSAGKSTHLVEPDPAPAPERNAVVLRRSASLLGGLSGWQRRRYTVQTATHHPQQAPEQLTSDSKYIAIREIWSRLELLCSTPRWPVNSTMRHN